MPVRSRKTRRKRRLRRKPALHIPIGKWLLFLFLFAVAACCIWTLYTGVRVQNSVKDIRFVKAEACDITETCEATGLVIRDEQVYVSPISGTFRRLISEGTRVARGTAVARVESDIGVPGAHGELGVAGDSRVHRSFEALRPGVVSYKLDGLETALLPGLVSQIDWHLYLGRRPKVYAPLQNGAHVTAGTPLFKIVDNYQFYVALFTDADKTRRIVRARGVKLEFLTNGEETMGTVTKDLSSHGGPVIVSIENTVPDLLHARELKVRLTVRTGRGVILPRTALVRRDGRELVYLSVRQGARARDVEVLAEEKDKVIVQGISEGDIVVSNPWIL